MEAYLREAKICKLKLRLLAFLGKCNTLCNNYTSILGLDDIVADRNLRLVFLIDDGGATFSDCLCFEDIGQVNDP